MKFSKVAMILVVTMAMSMGLAACNGGGGGTPSPSPTVEATGADTAVIETPKPQPKAKVDNLIGKWVSIYDAKDWLTITKSGTKYSYQDKDGKYPATFTEGSLIVETTIEGTKITVTSTYDPETKQLFVKNSLDTKNVNIYKKK